MKTLNPIDAPHALSAPFARLRRWLAGAALGFAIQGSSSESSAAATGGAAGSAKVSPAARVGTTTTLRRAPAQTAESSRTLVIESAPAIMKLPAAAATAAPPEASAASAGAGAPARDAGSAAPRARLDPAQKVVTLAETPVQAFVLSKNAPKSVDLAQAAVKLHKDEVLLNRTPGRPRPVGGGRVRPGGGAALALPYELHFLDAAGEQRSCELVAEVGSGFHVEKSGRLFVAELFVALKDRTDWSSGYDLPRALEVLVTAAVDELTPKILSLARTNTWQSIALGDDAPADEVGVKVRPVADPVGLELKLPVTRPRLSLTLNPAEIQGFGLDVSTLVVAVDGLPNPAGRAVTLRANAGRLSATRLVLDAEGTAETSLRSEGTGAVSISAQGVGAPSARSDGRFLWPIEFAVSAVLGALVGALIAFMRRRSAKRPELLQSFKEIAGGMLLGVLTAIAYAAGVNVLSLELPALGGEALVFTAAALGALGLAVKIAPPPDSATAPAR